MTTDSPIKSWIEERRTTHAKATAGRWWVEDPAPEDFQEGQYIIDSSACQDQWIVNFDDPENPNDAPAVVDAHNMFPRALDALEQVLELHRPKYLVSEGGLVPGYCKECYSHNWAWPCATVQAIEGAINHE